MITHCPACGAAGLEVFLECPAGPVHQNLLMPSREAAQNCTRGDLTLALCGACGMICNAAFNPRLLNYSGTYENTQTGSGYFRAYAEDLARRLVEQFDLRGKRLVEIGCGNGEFLRGLCGRGGNTGVGYDPAYRGPEVNGAVRFVREFYSPRYAADATDFACARHVLEHIDQPRAFIGQLARTLGSPGHPVDVFFEVPDVTWILDHGAFWDLFYEHCNYFSPASLTRLFRAAGFSHVRCQAEFGRQYLWLFASLNREGDAEPDPPVAPLAEKVQAFVARFQAHVVEVRDRIQSLMGRGPGVVWGAGAKGVTVLNVLQLCQDDIPRVVDINPRKQAKYVAGTGQEIVGPEALRESPPAWIVVVNPNYLPEIRATVAQLNLAPEFLTL